MAALLGAAAFIWDDSTGSGEHVLMLRAPLRTVRTAVRQNRFLHESIDFATRLVTVAGAGVHEIVAEMRYEDAAQTLSDFLLFGIRGGVVQYFPNLTDVARWDCYLVEPGGSAGLGTAVSEQTVATASMDADRGMPGFEDLSMQIRLRKTDGSGFAQPTSS